MALSPAGTIDACGVQPSTTALGDPTARLLKPTPPWSGLDLSQLPFQPAGASKEINEPAWGHIKTVDAENEVDSSQEPVGGSHVQSGHTLDAIAKVKPKSFSLRFRASQEGRWSSGPVQRYTGVSLHPLGP